MNYLHNLHFWLIVKYKVVNVKWQSGAYNMNSTEKLECNTKGAPPEPQTKHETHCWILRCNLAGIAFCWTPFCKVTLGIFVEEGKFFCFH